MFTAQDLINSIARETTIIKHLFEKVTPEMLDFRPTEKQRTLKEHLIYMTTMGSNIAHALQEGKYDFDRNAALTVEQTARGVENFPTMMDEQLMKIRAFLEELSEEDLYKEYDLFGNGPMSTKSYILEVMFKNFPAYRMMLFLYLKSAGAHHLGTSNVRGGRDRR